MRIPYRCNRRNLSQPWRAVTLRCASQKPSSTYLYSSSLSVQRLLCKMPDTCTLFVTVFSYTSYANISFCVCKHFPLFYTTAYFPRMFSNWGSLSSYLTLSSLLQSRLSTPKIDFASITKRSLITSMSKEQRQAALTKSRMSSAWRKRTVLSHISVSSLGGISALLLVKFLTNS